MSYQSIDKFSLESYFSYFLKILGNPQRGLQFIHVGGTSGKGTALTRWANFALLCLGCKSSAPNHTGDHDYLTEIHPQGEAFVRTLADHLQLGAAFLLDYGFPESEYYHVQRSGGTVMCHRAHRADADPLSDVGLKDITAHVNFTGVAVAAQDAGLDVLGYTNQAHFLMNCGLVEAMQSQPLQARVAAQKLLMEHEMGELFKVVALGRVWTLHFWALPVATGPTGFSPEAFAVSPETPSGCRGN